MYGIPWGSLFRQKVSLEKKSELEKKRPHIYKCKCEVTWVANGLEPQLCWACDVLVIPECFH